MAATVRSTTTKVEYTYRRKTTVNDSQELGQALKYLRENYGTMHDVARDAALPVSTVSSSHRGQQRHDEDDLRHGDLLRDAGAVVRLGTCPWFDKEG